MQFFTVLTLILWIGSPLSIARVIHPGSDELSISSHTDKDWSLKGIQKLLKKADIINDVLDNFTPTCYLAPYYSAKRVRYGNTIKPGKTQEAPSIQIFCPGKTEVSGLTIALTDPDAPSRDDDSMSEMCHWIAKVPEVLIGRDLIADVAAEDMVGVVDYKAPAPPQGTDKHRYVFVLLEGPNFNLSIPEERKHWGFEEGGVGVQKWADKEGLKVLGANFHYEKYHGKKKNNGFTIQDWF